MPHTLVSLSGVHTNQAWPGRTAALEALAKEHLSSPCVAMEIGTWFGEGSTAIWAKHLKRVYAYEKESRGDIYVLRGAASKLCAFFKPSTFDFIYIDGSHYYADVLEDIRLAKMLIKDGGTICGDDLEVAPSEARLVLARKNLHRDFIRLEDEDVWFHPGVLLAVHEHFRAVTNHAGIWSVVRRGEDWVAA